MFAKHDFHGSLDVTKQLRYPFFTSGPTYREEWIFSAAFGIAVANRHVCTYIWSEGNRFFNIISWHDHMTRPSLHSFQRAKRLTFLSPKYPRSGFLETCSGYMILRRTTVPSRYVSTYTLWIVDKIYTPISWHWQRTGAHFQNFKLLMICSKGEL